MARIISWFSGGIPSAVMTKLALQNHPELLIVNCIIPNEHSDNLRFAEECEQWFERPILHIRSDKYADCWEVWEKTRYLNGPMGARCTTELKKKVRQAFQLPDDVQLFGFTSDEKERAKSFVDNHPEINAQFPLIEQSFSKTHCFRVFESTNINIPEMYRLGYSNANCIGCVKGGAGYWNKIRVDFPDTFARMSSLEQSLNASCINGTFLKDLDPAQVITKT